MSYNGSGTFSLAAGNPVVTGTTISSTWANNTLSDIATGLTTAICKDGQTTPTANLPMGTFKHTGMGVGSAPTDSITLGQTQAQAFLWCSTSGGSANAQTLTPTPAITAYAAGQTFRFKAGFSNSGATTFAISGLTTIAAQSSGSACTGGELVANQFYQITLDTTSTAQISSIAPSAGALPFSDATALIKNSSDTTKKVIISAASVTTATTRTVTVPDQNFTIGVASNEVVDFRLTLTTATPVTTADVTGAVTIFCTPYKGNRIDLFDGTNWNRRTSAEFSLALGTLTGTLPYDVFCFDNAGVPTLEFLAWTNTTTRATALALQDGVLSKTGALTRRYMGTFFTTAATTTEDSIGNRYLFNMYNRVLRNCRQTTLENTVSWTYTTATWRQANANANNQFNVVIGFADQLINVYVSACASNGAANALGTGVGVDVTNANSATVWGALPPVAGSAVNPNAWYRAYPTVGKHTYAWLEFSTASGTTVWSGQAANGAQQSAIIGDLMA